MKKSKYIATMGIMLALALALQFLESLIPIPLPLGVKPGLSSIVIMAALVKLGFPSAITLAALKSGFVFITRGASAFCMSISGGLLSVAVMGAYCLISKGTKNGAGILVMSTLGGVFHNIGQLAAAALFMGTALTFSYAPILIAAGIVAGLFTGFIFKLIYTRIEVGE